MAKNMKELSKPAESLKRLVRPSENAVLQMSKNLKNLGKNVGKTPPALTIQRKAVRGAVNPEELSSLLSSHEMYGETVAEEHIKRRDAPETMMPKSPPKVAGVSSADSMLGYPLISKPFAMHCRNGHVIPTGQKVFTDGSSFYCPNCGEVLHIM